MRARAWFVARSPPTGPAPDTPLAAAFAAAAATLAFAAAMTFSTSARSTFPASADRTLLAIGSRFLTSDISPPVANPGIFPERRGLTDSTRCFGTTSSPGMAMIGTLSFPGTPPLTISPSAPEVNRRFPPPTTDADPVPVMMTVPTPCACTPTLTVLLGIFLMAPVRLFTQSRAVCASTPELVRS